MLPLGERVLNKLTHIVEQEMDGVGGQRIRMPSLVSTSLWETSKRLENASELFTLKDRKKAGFLLSPTHEEVVTSLVKDTVDSYKQLPLLLYQITTKFRDEVRPRFGLIRCREFLMKDMYSFHMSQPCLDSAYQNILHAYQRIFLRIGGPPVLQVRADTGDMGGALSHEFHYLSEIGDDHLLQCDVESSTVVNQEAALYVAYTAPASLVSFSNNGVDIVDFPKGRQVNPVVVQNTGQGQTLQGKDAVLVQAGDPCGEEGCGCKHQGRLKAHKGVEVAHIFDLGRKYSQLFKLKLAPPGDSPQEVFMGCYGIGLTRILAGVIEGEGGHDERGIVWPPSLSPFDAVVVLKEKTKEGDTVLEDVRRLFKDKDVLVDDRNNKRFGEKYAEALLMGVSRVVVYDTKKGSVEVVQRGKEDATKEVKSIDDFKVDF